MDTGTFTPATGIYRDLYSGCEAYVEQGSVLPAGPDNADAKWFLVHALDDSWMRTGVEQEEVVTVTFLADYLCWDYLEAARQQPAWHNLEWTKKGALLTLRYNQVADWVQVFSNVANWSLRDNMQAAVRRIPASV